jgi:hypothetical protein
MWTDEVTAMVALRNSFRRLLRAEEQARSAKTVEVFGWLILIEGGLILLAPHLVVWILHLPALGDQAERYFRFLGLLVGGIGMLYVVSGRMNAEGFVFASLLDRPLVPPAMALLWYFAIVPGPLALTFALQDFGSFLWTLVTWLAERRSAETTLLPAGSTFSDDLDSPSIRAIQTIYSAAMFEDLKMFQVVDKIVDLFQAGMLSVGRGEGVRKLHEYVESAPRRLPESERRAIYLRALGLGSGPAIDINREFNGLWRRFLAAVTSLGGAGTGASQEALRQAGQALVSNLSLHGHGVAYLAATELQSQMRDALHLLADRGIQSASGARDVWQVIETVSARHLGGAADGARLRTLETSGATILRWLAAKAGDLSRASNAPVLDPAESRLTGDATPSGQDLIRAVERWLAASG